MDIPFNLDVWLTLSNLLGDATRIADDRKADENRLEAERDILSSSLQFGKKTFRLPIRLRKNCLIT